MRYGFDTEDLTAATGALLIYAVYRSRDRRRYKTTPDMWGQIERFAKSSAKRARTLPEWIERFKPRLACESLRPSAMKAGLTGRLAIASHIDSAGNQAYIQMAEHVDVREFLTQVLARINQRAVLDLIYRETTWIVLLVRDRLEREKPIEKQFETETHTEES